MTLVSLAVSELYKITINKNLERERERRKSGRGYLLACRNFFLFCFFFAFFSPFSFFLLFFSAERLPTTTILFLPLRARDLSSSLSDVSRNDRSTEQYKWGEGVFSFFFREKVVFFLFFKRGKTTAIKIYLPLSSSFRPISASLPISSLSVSRTLSLSSLF